ncbi:cobalt-precorrin-6A reductase [Paracoccus gahaiensis]|uniref:Cobalt-precorrin-6A reductase n=1 Tax=Paracoccus gahaiensis TaxID=1706839 RepID=A0A4U0RB62_9RHOB|nr:cobalt-precorrin-6A reductase [Paracoccus gahaiensis]TJZ92503.1 cobalt-precorrin-6A reductase [Paracoccus gahaiensis]
MTRVLLLGGTTEASRLALLLAAAGVDAVFSYAGRTAAPVAQPLPLRIGGFGGPAGLARYLQGERITHLIDATHPFAAQISHNAQAASTAQGVPLLALQRPEWQAGPDDLWTRVPDIGGAVAALPVTPARVFLAIGKQTLAPFAPLPHDWLLRLVDPPEALPLPRAQVVIARGPFTAEGDRALMQAHRITHLVAKNSGGAGASGKLQAARDLGVRVVMIDRPALPDRISVATPEQALDWLHQTAPALRGA